jgi:hypothetical protein
MSEPKTGDENDEDDKDDERAAKLRRGITLVSFARWITLVSSCVLILLALIIFSARPNDPVLAAVWRGVHQGSLSWTLLIAVCTALAGAVLSYRAGDKPWTLVGMGAAVAGLWLTGLFIAAALAWH